MVRPAFTLPEVVVALVLLEVGVVGAVAAGQYALRLQGNTAFRTEALAAATALADSLMSADTVFTGESSSGNIRLRWVGSGALLITATHVARRGVDTVTIRLPGWTGGKE